MEKVCPMENSRNQTSEDKSKKDTIVEINKKECPISKLRKFFGKQFCKFYTIRFILTLLQKLFKLKFNILNLNFFDLFDSFFNMANLKTGLFLSLMPTLFRFLILLMKNSNFFKNLDERLITFLSGFISSLIGIIISEKSGIMNFIILSVAVRSLHSMLVVWLKNNGYPVHNRLVGFLVLNVACALALYIYFLYPSYKPITKLIDRYALFLGNEKNELYAMREILRVER